MATEGIGPIEAKLLLLPRRFLPRRLGSWVLLAMLGGIGVGQLCHAIAATPAEATQIGAYFSMATDVFLRLIKMIIAPLVLSTLVAGIATMGDSSRVGRIGLRSVGWFIAASFVSLTLGLIMVHFFSPGAGMKMAISNASSSPSPPAEALTPRVLLAHAVPQSLFEAMANNEVLQIVTFSILAGVALNGLGERGALLVRGAEALASLMLRITDYVMRVAPIAVFAAIAAVVSVRGIGILFTLGKFVGSFYLSVLTLWAFLFLVALAIIGRPACRLFSYIRAPALLAFSTASSESAFPRTLEELERFGVPRRISGFVLPLGYSFNMDGSMMYCAFAVLFIAQASGIDLSLGQQASMLLLLMLTSKGMAGVPRASLVVIAATLHFFGLPEAGLVLLLGVDQFLDMGRSATNVVGNAVAAAVIAKWEGELVTPRDAVGSEA